MSDCIPCQLAYQGDLVALKELIEQNIKNATKIDEDGRQPLHWAITGKRQDVITYLLSLEGLPVNTADEAGWTPLHIASSTGNILAVQQLLEHKAKVDVETTNGQTPLHYAASKNHVEVVKLLLEKEADGNAKDVIGETPLFRAVARQNTVIVRLLIDAGAELELVDHRGNTVMHVACSEDSSDSAALIYKKCPGLM
eukprot:Ihof_evm3s543 gene=Ihof_evmTU3s543